MHQSNNGSPKRRTKRVGLGQVRWNLTCEPEQGASQMQINPNAISSTSCKDVSSCFSRQAWAALIQAPRTGQLTYIDTRMSRTLSGDSPRLFSCAMDMGQLQSPLVCATYRECWKCPSPKTDYCAFQNRDPGLVLFHSVPSCAHTHSETKPKTTNKTH